MARKKHRSRRTQQQDAGWKRWWHDLSRPWQHGVCVAFLIAVSFAFFAPIHFTGQALVGGDSIQWRAMAESVLEYERETGRQALWATNPFGGMPAYMVQYANQIPQLDEIPRMLRQVIWPSSHFIVLLLGMYFLVTWLTGNLWAGVISAIAFGFTTYIPVILAAGHNTKFIALSFAPWMVLAFAYALRRPRLIAALFFAAALALNLRADHVQITYYLSFLLGIWWLVEGIFAFQEGRMAAFGKVTAFLAVGSVLGVMMVAQPYLVHAEYKDYTIRGSGEGGQPAGLDLDYAMQWSQGVGEMITYAIADAYGGSSRTGHYWGPKPFTEGPHYLGGIILLLAAFGVWLVRRRVVLAFGVGVFVLSLFAFGRHFPLLNEFMYQYFPLFDSFRVPETWLSIVSLALAVLAGIGVAEIAKKMPNQTEREERTRTLYFGCGAAVGLVFLLWISGGLFLDFQKDGERQQLMQQIAQQRPDLSPQDPQVQAFLDEQLSTLEEERRDKFARDARRTLLFLILGTAAIALYRRENIPAWTMQIALVLLVLVDLWGVDRRHLGEEQLTYTRSTADHITEYDVDRFIANQREEDGSGEFRMVSFAEGNPMTNARPAFFHETLNGYHGAKLRLFQDYIDHIYRDAETGMPNLNALRLMNTRYVVAGGVLPDTEGVYQGEESGMVVSEIPNPLPRGLLIGETEVIEDFRAMWQRIQSEEYDPAETALLPEEYDLELTPIEEGSVAEVNLIEHTPREITWQVNTDAPRLFVASEIYYPAGWYAFIDGEEVPIHRVNYLLRGVQVPEGEFVLEMRFEPASHAVSMSLTGVSTFFVYGGILVILGLRWRNRRRSDQPEADPTQDE